ncbi:uncharacterized protein LOC113279447 [Papaver somniferum]|uniref:uncharacterized protein LOC113279447 n=1 Tax=Papaver somniferum TaxID=3469 RepID=UPI000E6F5FC0|nr:uncharacterized protein LOC113279447 [Papaver somniferum]
MIHAVAIDAACDVFRIKKYVGGHTCGSGVKLRSPSVSKKIVNHLIHDYVMHNPLIKPREIADYIKVGAGVNIKYHHAYHGLELSHQEIFGNDVKSYTNLVWWVNALKETNLGSYMDFQFNDATKKLERSFIAIGAFIEGFYPLAYALVPGEDVDNWDWFMRLLREIPNVFPKAHRGYCYCDYPIRKSDEKFKDDIVSKKVAYALSLARFGQATLSVDESFNNWIRREKRLLARTLVDMIRLLKEHIQIGRVWNVTQVSDNVYEVHSSRSHTIISKIITTKLSALSFLRTYEF